MIDNKSKINVESLYKSFAVFYTGEVYKGEKVLISILEDFIDSSRTYSRIFIAIVKGLKNSRQSEDEKIFLILQKYSQIPIWLEFDIIEHAVKFVENTVITLGNMLLLVDNWKLKNPTPRFSHLYPPDKGWLVEELFSKITQYSPKKCDHCPFFRDIQ